MAGALGMRVLLIEKGKMGGDCLNYGCVPSKALLAAARHATEPKRVAPFGLKLPRAEIDFAKVNAHVHGVIAAIGHTKNVPVCNHVTWASETPSRSAELAVPSAAVETSADRPE